MSNPRIARLEDQIRKIVAQMLERRIKDPRLGFVTITEVRMTGDGREATIFYTDFGRSLDGREADAMDGTVDTPAALESAKGLLRTTIGKQLGLKFTPSLTFVLDATEQSAQDMADLLARVRDEDADLANRRMGAQYAGESDPYRKPNEADEDL
ncbi:MAG: 30S ribosome-binding factor RbfA [Brooklawnia sp.]|jgi:ribosome-binding factor A